MNLLVRGICLCSIILSTFSTVSAEQRFIETTGTYYAESYEDLSTAKERAQSEAVEIAGLKAGIYVKNISESQDSIVTDDVIEMISANVLEIQNEPVFEIIDDNNENRKIVRCHLTVLIDDKNISEAIFRDKSENLEAVLRGQRYEAEKSKLLSTLENLKSQMTKSQTDSERQKILDEIKFNERLFSANEHFNAGNKFMYTKDFASALEEFNQTIALNPNHAWAYNNRGIMMVGKGYPGEAMKDFTRSIELSPTAEAYNNRGNIFFFDKKYTEAVAEYSKSLEFDSNYDEAYTNRGLAYVELKQFDEALVDFSKAIELNPNNEEAYDNRGSAYLRAGKYDEAIRDYDRALEINPDFARAYNNRGYAYQKRGDYDLAIDDYGTALRLNPNYTTARKNLERIQKALDNLSAEE